jgi:outer membrane protein W
MLKPMKVKTAFFTVCILLAYRPQEAGATPPGTEPAHFHSPNRGSAALTHFQAFAEDRLVLGARILRHRLTDNTRPEDTSRQETFLGFINQLDLENEYSFALFAEYHVHPFVFLELTYDRIEARTMNFNNNLSDGNVIMSGPIFSVYVQYPLHERVTPFVGLGLAPWSASFDHDDWWTLGWASPEAYDAAGRPGTDVGRRRIIGVNRNTGMVYSAGLRFEPMDHLHISILARYIDIETQNVSFTGGPTNNLVTTTRSGNFPLKHRSFGLTVGYRF